MAERAVAVRFRPLQNRVLEIRPPQLPAGHRHFPPLRFPSELPVNLVPVRLSAPVRNARTGCRMQRGVQRRFRLPRGLLPGQPRSFRTLPLSCQNTPVRARGA